MIGYSSADRVLLLVCDQLEAGHLLAGSPQLATDRRLQHSKQAPVGWHADGNILKRQSNAHSQTVQTHCSDTFTGWNSSTHMGICQQVLDIQIHDDKGYRGSPPYDSPMLERPKSGTWAV
jgi:hypothetical protein